MASARTRVVVIVSDGSRREPRAELFAAVRRALAVVRDDHLTLAIANGTHRPGALERLGLPEEVLRRHRVVNHDAHDEASMVEMGRTSRGTRLRVNRCLAEADLVVVTGLVKPHYFAGWGGGAKGIFPGLGHDEDIRQNHKLKADPASSLGRADANPCREDLEEAARRLGRDTYMLDVVEAGGVILGAVAGDVVYAHREGVRLARPYCEVEAEPAEVVVVSAPLPVSGSLYQASKLIPPAGLLLKDGGVVIVVRRVPGGHRAAHGRERGDLRAGGAPLPARAARGAAGLGDARGHRARHLRHPRAEPRGRARPGAGAHREGRAGRAGAAGRERPRPAAALSSPREILARGVGRARARRRSPRRRRRRDGPPGAC